MPTEQRLSTPADPRPLVGEPLSLDLMNTRWIPGHPDRHLLETVDGLSVWLGCVGLADRCRADDETLAAVLRTRDALVALLEPPFDATPLNDVLARGRIRLRLAGEDPVEEIDVDAPAWLPGWLAARDYLDLLSRAPKRIRPCANPECVLHFFDVSKNGSRRWCSMTGCGNRAKAGRHYARHRDEQSD